MPEYRRAFCPGGTFFLTVVTNFRRPILTTELSRKLLRAAIQATRSDRPFTVNATVLLPDHWHMVWTLPKGDADFSTRARLVKSRFTHEFLRCGGTNAGLSESRRRKGEQSVWQRRFWEHTVRDERDFERICDYIHYNPVRHGLVSCPHAWPYSTFARFVRNDFYERTWQCGCRGGAACPLKLDDIAEVAGE